MAISFTPNLISSGYNLSLINDNFDKIAEAFENAVSRTGSSPNQMQADIDLNNNDILNADSVTARRLVLDGVEVGTEDVPLVILDQILDARDDALQAAQDAEDAAASVGLPVITGGDALKYVQVKADATGYQFNTITIPPSSIPTPADLTAFKAVSTTSNKVAWYVGSMWEFKAGNYTAAVALDTTNVIFVKANDTADSVGCWVRVLVNNTLTPEMAGAVGDGVTDDSNAFNTALTLISFLGGGTLRAQKSYKLLNVLVPSNTTVDLRGSNITGVGGGSTNKIFYMAGSKSGVKHAISNVATGSILVTCSTAANAGLYAVGDYVLIQNEVFASPGNAGKNQEIARVAASDAVAGTVSLENTLIGTYSGSTPTIEKITPIVNSQIIGGSTYLAYNSNNEGAHIYLDLCVRCKVQGVTVQGCSNLPGITVRECTDIDIVENRVRIGYNMTVSNGYGISIEEASHGVRIHRNETSRVRENICTNRCRFIIWSENQIFGNYINGINSHSSTNENISIIDNQIHAITAGVAISFGQGSGSNNDNVGIIKGNIIRGTFGDGIQVSATASTSTKVIIDANIISAFGQNLTGSSGIYCTNAENIQITNNQINAGGAVGTPYGIFISTLNKSIIAHNLIESGSFGIAITGGTKIKVQGNNFEGITSQCVRIPNADSVAVWIIDNFSNVSNQSINATGTYQHRNSWNTLP